MDEQVLVVPRESLPDGAGWHGLRTDALDGFAELVSREGSFRPRAAMEADPSFKQVIPYLVLRDGDRFFLMRRTRAGRRPAVARSVLDRRGRPPQSRRRRSRGRAAPRVVGGADG